VKLIAASDSSDVQVLAPGDVGQSSFGAISSAAATGGGFVALDVGALSSLAGDAGPPGTPTAPPRTPVSPVRPRSTRSAASRDAGRARRNAPKILFAPLLPKLTLFSFLVPVP